MKHLDHHLDASSSNLMEAYVLPGNFNQPQELIFNTPLMMVNENQKENQLSSQLSNQQQSQQQLADLNQNQQTIQIPIIITADQQQDPKRHRV